MKWGFLRETIEAAKKAGLDKYTGLHRTGLDEYLAAIFPNIDDWVHDKSANISHEGKKLRNRPDYRSETLKLIIEFDGLQHYTSPDQIENDMRMKSIYESAGYTCVRIPYFIQLTNTAVKELFGVDVAEPLFDLYTPSISMVGKNTPAYLCPAGIRRMANEFRRFPDQYAVNMHVVLLSCNSIDDWNKTEWQTLDACYNVSSEVAVELDTPEFCQLMDEFSDNNEEYHRVYHRLYKTNDGGLLGSLRGVGVGSYMLTISSPSDSSFLLHIDYKEDGHLYNTSFSIIGDYESILMQIESDNQLCTTMDELIDYIHLNFI